MTIRKASFVDPAWAPSGRRLVFGIRSNAGAFRGLLIVPSSGGRPRRLTRGADRLADWSPNGNWIAFVRGESEIYLTHPTGKGLHRIFSGSTLISDLAWSPTSRQLALVIGRAGANGCPRIAVMSTSGNTETISPEGVCALQPSWSPGGTRLVYVTYEPRGATPSNLVVSKPDGTSATRLTPGPADLDPAWSPDGRLIAFSTNGERWVATVRPDGTGRRRITHTAHWGDAPVGWSPGGRWILFQRFDLAEDFGGGRVLIVRRDGSSVRTIAENSELGTASWSPR